jgi:hypothetical protein
VRDAAHRSGDAPAATNKVEAFNGFSEWVRFGNSGVLADNEPIEQEKALKFNSVLTNAIILHNTLDIADVVRTCRPTARRSRPRTWPGSPPYCTEHSMRFGEYSTRELDPGRGWSTGLRAALVITARVAPAEGT